MADNKVWLSTPVSFNDPFDCAINLDRSKLAESVAHAVEKATQNAEVEDSLKVPSEEDELAYERLRDGLGSLMQNIGVFCLSEAPDEILMWSHYAENHKGFCIEYKIDETSPLTTMARPVKYTDVYPSLSVKNLHAGATEAFLEACLFTKAKQWSYEKEWRAIMDVGGKLYQAPAPSPPSSSARVCLRPISEMSTRFFALHPESNSGKRSSLIASLDSVSVRT